MDYSITQARILYVYTISDDEHRGLVKISDILLPEDWTNESDIKRIVSEKLGERSYLQNVPFEVLHVEDSIFEFDKEDRDTHVIEKQTEVCKAQSVIDFLEHQKKKLKYFHEIQVDGNKVECDIWVEASLDEVKSAINLVREDLKKDHSEFFKISYRPEQQKAIAITYKHFKDFVKNKADNKIPENGKRFLWNAKMRFGKTLCGLEVAKQLGVNATLIVTHRPVVDEGWEKDFKKIFFDVQQKYLYARRNADDGATPSDYFIQLTQNLGKGNENTRNGAKKLVFFVSMQYLRLSDAVGGEDSDPLKKAIMDYDWDLVLVDEAHEGTTSDQGEKVIEKLSKPSTGILSLSGTPFNLLEKYESSEVYTWDYVMEQTAKNEWDELRHGDPNPYLELPQMKMLTFTIPNVDDIAYAHGKGKFTFADFFQVWTGDVEKDKTTMPAGQKGHFIHEGAVNDFLNSLTTNTNYPYSKTEFQNNLRHSFWVLPGVDAANAMFDLLKGHKVFGKSGFRIVNVAGEGNVKKIVKDKNDPLTAVKVAIKDKESSHTITLSCGKLTTGVSIPDWTAVLCMKGGDDTPASNYMQTIFRVQTHGLLNKRQKTQCFVFDFAPKRALVAVSEAAKMSAIASGRSQGKETREKEEEFMKEFLTLCPIISMNDAALDGTHITANELFIKLNEVYISRAVNSGYDDSSIYDQKAILDLNLDVLNRVKAAVGKTAKRKDEKVDIATGPDGEPEPTPKQPSQSTPQTSKEEQKERANRIAVLRSIAIRIPLLVYGAEMDDSLITIDNFTNIVDDASWEEFMPKDGNTGKAISKDLFNEIKSCFDAAVFNGSARRIRDMVRSADELGVEERIARIALIFKNFRNPDKETVLTPWSVVNMHIGETLGGYNFFDENYKNFCERVDERTQEKVRDVREIGDLTGKVFTNDFARVLEINSKTGLYPLYMAYSLHKGLLREWDYVLKNNLFVVCRTPMAVSITKRTLVGFRKNDNGSEVKTNVVCYHPRAKDVLKMKLTEALVEIDGNQRMLKDILDDKGELPHEYENLETSVDMVEVLGKNPNVFERDVQDAIDFWNINTREFIKEKNEDLSKMKFTAIVGNPPYQGINHAQIYPSFYLTSIALGSLVTLIFPTGWQKPKKTGGLGKMNCEEVKADRQIHFIDNRQNVFERIAGAEWTNIILWEKGYNNGLDGKQKMLENGENPINVKLSWDESEIVKPSEIVELADLVMGSDGFETLQNKTSRYNPYGIRTDAFREPEKYGLVDLSLERKADTDYKIVGANRNIRYLPNTFAFPTQSPNHKNEYRVFVPYAWGNMNEKSGLGGAFANIIIGKPNEIVSETFLESGWFSDAETAQKHAKFLMTRFARALLYRYKTSQHSTSAWGAVPVQTYTEDWWSEDIDQLELRLFEKYNLPESVKKFILTNFQRKTMDDITDEL